MRRRGPARKDLRACLDRGFSLVELLVAMVIFGVLLALLSGVVIQILQANTGTRARLANVDQVRTGMDALARNLRTAIRPEQLNPTCVDACDFAFESIDGDRVVFYANVGDEDSEGRAAPTRFTYAFEPDADDLTGLTAVVTEVRQKVAPGWTSGDYTFAPECSVGGPAVTGCTARNVTAGLRWPYPAGEEPFTFHAGDQAVPLPAGAEVPTVMTVDISLPVGTAAAPSPSVESTVFLPNSTLGR